MSRRDVTMADLLAGQVAVVTGASRGIGKAIALALAEAGCDVVICGRTRHRASESPGSLEETAMEIERFGHRAVVVEADLSQGDGVDALVRESLVHLNRIDIIVNNAALQIHYEPTLTSEISLLDDAWALNVRAPYLLSQLFGRGMVERGNGVIINISSPSGRLPGPPAQERRKGWSALAYGISKAGLDRLSFGLAHELFQSGVAVVTVYPGFTRTELLEASTPPGLNLDRAESPDLVAKAVVRICMTPMSYTGLGLTWQEVLGS
jgi:NAD(P)-dependent dehydrogenase (short-subunit alcohol dehydrogenase family)